MKKKIIIIIILLFIFIFCTIKFLTFNNIYNNMKKNYEITNFEVTKNSNNYKYVITRKDNTIIYKTYSKNGNDIIHTFTFYTDGVKNYVFDETNKTYKITEQDYIGDVKQLYSKLEFSNPNLTFFDKLKATFTTKISKVEKNGIKCYYIIQKYEDNQNFEYYINCENYLLVYANELNYSDYKLNSITEENINIPILENYIFSEN